MLKLTRRIGEEILIDKGNIRIKIVSMKQGHVTLSIVAPKTIDVNRGELFLKKLLNPERTLVRKKFRLNDIEENEL